MFSSFSSRGLKYNKFDLSHEFKFTCDMGKLIPVVVREVLPGDKITIGSQALIRLTAQIAPVMHKVDCYFRSFYVPNRLLWYNWEEFITGGKNNTSDAVAPYLEITNASVGSIYDYMGIPTGVENKLKVNAMPFRAYNLICNHYFRDQNLQDELPMSLDDGYDGNNNDYSLQNVLWRKGYFTSAMATPQAGTGANLPLFSQDLPVKTTDKRTFFNFAYTTGGEPGTAYVSPYGTPTSGSRLTNIEANVDTNPAVSGKDTNLYAETDSSTVSIETLRNAFKVQSYLEKLQRAGYHMKDWLLSFFGVRASDGRLQIPEYIGGSRQSIFFSEILQQSETSTTPLGTQAGTSTTLTGLKFYKKYCEEHGWLITLMYLRPTDEYFQGLERQWTRENKFDYYLPQFANLGEQAIFNKEIYAQGTSDDDEVFGYQTRYQEYRSVENRVAGHFKTNDFKAWTMTREFGAKPVLNENFIE